MAIDARRWAGLSLILLGAVVGAARAQVFTVGEKSATADIATDFTPTRVELPNTGMTQRGQRDLLRNLEAEQGFAHRVLPLGAIVTLAANGNLTPGSEGYKKLIYTKGQSAAPGDRVVVTSLEVKGDRILIDFNGGPYVKHRFLRHLSVGVGGAETAPVDDGAVATGCRVALVFEGGVPEVSAPEVKALLLPLVDFGAKTGEIAYAETLPAPIKTAIASHEVLVGMNRRMVLASMGAPESKVRESSPAGQYEEWIYGHQPQTMRFVRFMGDRVNLIKVAAMGKPIEIHDQDELAGYLPPLKTRAVRVAAGPEGETGGAAPTLLKPGETTQASTGDTAQRKVQFPDEKKPVAKAPATAPQEKMTGSSTP